MEGSDDTDNNDVTEHIIELEEHDAMDPWVWNGSGSDIFSNQVDGDRIYIGYHYITIKSGIAAYMQPQYMVNL